MKESSKMFLICPICHKSMTVGWVDESLVGVCENKECESSFVFGDPIQKELKKLVKKH